VEKKEKENKKNGDNLKKNQGRGKTKKNLEKLAQMRQNKGKTGARRVYICRSGGGRNHFISRGAGARCGQLSHGHAPGRKYFMNLTSERIY
jgi:hypothetical protein